MIGPTPPFVVKADEDSVSVQTDNESAIQFLKSVQFAESSIPGWYSRPVKNDEEKAALFSLLREKGYVFSDGREWCPKEVFEYLRDKGLLSGTFNVIRWTGPGEWFIAQD